MHCGMSHLMAKQTKWHVRPAKTQISLGIRPVCSESSLSAWRKLGSLATQWSDQTGRMPRLIWVFAGRTCHFVCFVVRRLIHWCCWVVCQIQAVAWYATLVPVTPVLDHDFTVHPDMLGMLGTIIDHGYVSHVNYWSTLSSFFYDNLKYYM